jgi:hypothetical protein
MGTKKSVDICRDDARKQVFWGFKTIYRKRTMQTENKTTNQPSLARRAVEVIDAASHQYDIVMFRLTIGVRRDDRAK